MDPMENTVFYCPECVFRGLLPGNGCPIVDRLCWGNVFTHLLPSNGYTRHNKKNGLDGGWEPIQANMTAEVNCPFKGHTGRKWNSEKSSVCVYILGIFRAP
jgi:hypothetical protein